MGELSLKQAGKGNTFLIFATFNFELGFSFQTPVGSILSKGKVISLPCRLKSFAKLSQTLANCSFQFIAGIRHLSRIPPGNKTKDPFSPKYLTKCRWCWIVYYFHVYFVICPLTFLLCLQSVSAPLFFFFIPISLSAVIFDGFDIFNFTYFVLHLVIFHSEYRSSGLCRECWSWNISSALAESNVLWLLLYIHNKTGISQVCSEHSTEFIHCLSVGGCVLVCQAADAALSDLYLPSGWKEISEADITDLETWGSCPEGCTFKM